MSNHTGEAVVGGVVIAAAVGFLFYASQFAGMGGASSYPLTASFRSVEGITVGTDVRMVGVKIGSVSDLALDTEMFRATATLMVQDGIPVPNDSTAVVASEGLLGGNYVEILPGASYDNYEPGQEILDTQGSVSLMNLLLQYVAGDGGSSSN